LNNDADRDQLIKNIIKSHSKNIDISRLLLYIYDFDNTDNTEQDESFDLKNIKLNCDFECNNDIMSYGDLNIYDKNGVNVIDIDIINTEISTNCLKYAILNGISGVNKLGLVIYGLKK
jgi:hypothetical protein